MSEPKYFNILKQKTEFWNKWREENPDIKPDFTKEDLRGENLCGVNLSGANLSGVNVSGASLIKANLVNANLSSADLRGADFNGAYLGGADLTKADLNKANLTDADLSEAYLSEANISEADLYGAILFRADLTKANLSGAFLDNADLRKADLIQANLSEAFLSGANLRKADLTKANLTKANLSGANLNEADLRRADLTKADLSGATLVRAKLNEANLASCRIYGISAWDLVLDNTTQTGLIITKSGDPAVTVDDIEVAQFIYFMLTNKKIRRVINALTSKAVLILGRFTKKRKEILYALRDKLSSMDYLPIIFDFEKPSDRDFTETVLTLACLSKFVIIDLTNPSSTPHESKTTIPDLAIPFQPILQEGQRKYAMFSNFVKYPWMLKGKTYKNKDDLINKIEILTEAAEAKYLEIRAQKNNSSSIFTPL